ncbi:MAG: TetR/AcrR family transcriptional regulator, partial [Mesorhizobium sp.]
MTDHLTKLQEEGVVVTDVDPETTSRLINGASSQAAQRIANSNDPEATSKKAIAAFKQLLEGLRQKP